LLVWSPALQICHHSVRGRWVGRTAVGAERAAERALAEHSALHAQHDCGGGPARDACQPSHAAAHALLTSSEKTVGVPAVNQRHLLTGGDKVRGGELEAASRVIKTNPAEGVRYAHTRERASQAGGQAGRRSPPLARRAGAGPAPGRRSRPAWRGGRPAPAPTCSRTCATPRQQRGAGRGRASGLAAHAPY
jgi:hypothetical protein